MSSTTVTFSLNGIAVPKKMKNRNIRNKTLEKL